VTLKIDGRPIAFHYYLSLEGRMYVNRIAFDPAFGRFSPGLINTLDAIEAAAAEGVTRIEFLGGAERYKLELADHLEPLYQGFGLAGSLKGKAAVAGRVGGIRLRKQLKRSAALRRFYFEGLAPARRLLGRVG
jgi:CelD/BcsL family acetyltransferase involved in cellulose biosynthesis